MALSPPGLNSAKWFCLLLCGFPMAPLLAEEYPWLRLKATESGLGDVHVGMTLTQASENFVISFLDATYFYGNSDCASYAFGDGQQGEQWHVRFLVENHVLQRIDIYNPAIKSVDGFGVGTDMQEVTAYYDGRYSVEMGYDPSDRHIRVPQSDGWALEYTGHGTLTVDEGHRARLHPDEVLVGPIRRWSIGNLDAGTVEGCL
ncbi:MAG: hypothetical protein KAG82_04900 [Alcanivoracaceae bacterium]|nr:hypothetical protein [Alcanivoracaceae bacterium]